jgi:hypothetical protein
MLQIALALGSASPLVLEHRIVAAFRSWVRLTVRLALAFVVAATVYGTVLLAMIESYPSRWPLASVLYGIGLALASLLAVCAGTLVSPAKLSGFTLSGISAFAVLLPIELYMHWVAAGVWWGVGLWYLASSIAGSVMATKLLSRMRNEPRGVGS